MRASTYVRMLLFVTLTNLEVSALTPAQAQASETVSAISNTGEFISALLKTASDLKFMHDIGVIAESYYPALEAKRQKYNDSFLGVQINVRTDLAMSSREILSSSSSFGGKTADQALQLTIGHPRGPTIAAAAPKGTEDVSLYLYLFKDQDAKFAYRIAQVTSDSYWTAKKNFDSNLRDYLIGTNPLPEAKAALDDFANHLNKIQFKSSHPMFQIPGVKAVAMHEILRVNLETGDFSFDRLFDLSPGRNDDEALRLLFGTPKGVYEEEDKIESGVPIRAISLPILIYDQGKNPAGWRVPNLTPEFIADAVKHHDEYQAARINITGPPPPMSMTPRGGTPGGLKPTRGPDGETFFPGFGTGTGTGTGDGTEGACDGAPNCMSARP